MDLVARHGATDLLISGAPSQVPGADQEDVGADEPQDGNYPAKQEPPESRTLHK
jgi:hypothetical protein